MRQNAGAIEFLLVGDKPNIYVKKSRFTWKKLMVFLEKDF